MRTHEAMKRNAPSVLLPERGPLFSDAEMLARTLALGKQSYFLFDPVTDEVTWPPETYRLWGLDPDKRLPVTRNWILSTIHPDDRETVVEALGNPDLDEVTYEYRVSLPDGSQRHIRSNVVRDRDPSGRVVRLFGLLRDVTDQRRIAGELSVMPLTSWSDAVSLPSARKVKVIPLLTTRMTSAVAPEPASIWRRSICTVQAM